MTKISHDSEISAVGQQVFTACAFIHYNFDGIEKVFLPKRAAGKKFLPNVFELPGGHVDFGEDMIHGLKREIREEFGMMINVGDPFYVFTYTNPVKGSHSIEVIYFAAFHEHISAISLNPEDHSEYGWFSENELSLAATDLKGLEDVEFVAIQKGFDILNGKSLTFS